MIDNVADLRYNYQSKYKAVNKADAKKADNLFLLLFGIYLSFNINGFFGSIPNLRGWFNLLMSAVVVFYAIIITPNFFNEFFVKNKAYLLFMLFSLIAVFDFIVGNSNSFLLSFLPVLVYYVSFTYLKRKRASKGLVLWIMLNIIYKIILTFYYLNIDELIVKRYDHNGYDYSDGITRSIIGYGSIYFVTPCALIWLECFFAGKNKYRFIALICAVLSICIVFASQVSMMIFALVPMLFFYLILRKLQSVFGKRVIYFIFVCVVLVFIFRIPIFTYLSNLDFLGSTVQNRIDGLLTVMNNDLDYVYSQYSGSMVEGDSVVNRVYSYSESLKALVHNFFLGKLTPNALEGAGHSSIIDFISRYGIFIAIPLFLLLINGYKNNLKNYKNNGLIIKIIYVYILIISCLNNLSFSAIFFMVYIIMPQVLSGISNDKGASL